MLRVFCCFHAEQDIWAHLLLGVEKGKVVVLTFASRMETNSSHSASLRNLVRVENCVHCRFSWETFHWIVSKSVKLCSDEIHLPNNFLTALTLIELEIFHLLKNILWHRNEEKGEKTIFLPSQRERKKKSGCWV